MEKEMIVTLDDQYKYYLADEVVHEGIRYFLANELDEKEELSENSSILFEVKEGTDIYLEELEEEDNTDLYKTIMTMFTVNFVSMVDEIQTKTAA